MHKHILRRSTSVRTSVTFGSSSSKSRSTMSSSNNNYNACNSSLSCSNVTLNMVHGVPSSPGIGIGHHIHKMVNTMIAMKHNGQMV